MNIAEKLSKARAELVMDHPFFGALALRMKLVERGDIETMAIDGVHIFYNPAFVEGLSMPELRFVFAHEVMHVALMHHLRQGERDAEQWNIAGDHAINLSLLEAMPQAMPKGGLADVQYANLSSEAIYARLPRKPEGKGGGKSGEGKPGQDPGRCGSVMPQPNPQGQAMSPAELAQAEAECKVMVLQAAQAARAQGKLPASLDRLAKALAEPEVDWRAALRRFFDALDPADYSWSRPSRRYLAQGMILPGVVKEPAGEIVVVVDTSGSINADILNAFASEIDAIAKELRPTVHVMSCDAAMQTHETFEPGEDVKLNVRGGGGTDFRPPFARVEAEDIQPKALVYFTDLLGTFPKDAPEYPVLWCSTTDGLGGRYAPPFGEVLRIMEDK